MQTGIASPYLPLKVFGNEAAVVHLLVAIDTPAAIAWLRYEAQLPQVRGDLLPQRWHLDEIFGLRLSSQLFQLELCLNCFCCEGCGIFRLVSQCIHLITPLKAL